LFWRVCGAECTNILRGVNMERVEMGFGDLDWIELAQGRDWWRPLVNAVMFHKMRGIS